MLFGTKQPLQMLQHCYTNYDSSILVTFIPHSLHSHQLQLPRPHNSTLYNIVSCILNMQTLSVTVLDSCIVALSRNLLTPQNCYLLAKDLTAVLEDLLTPIDLLEDKSSFADRAMIYQKGFWLCESYCRVSLNNVWVYRHFIKAGMINGGYDDSVIYSGTKPLQTYRR